MPNVTIEDWFLMPPLQGPPLPRFLGIYWPWIVEPDTAPPPDEPPPDEPPPGGPPAADIRNFDFIPAKGNYKIGDRVFYSATYEYKGKAQPGQLVLSIGTGVYPTFLTKQTYLPLNVAFDEAMDWVMETISGSFILTEALEPGQTYSVRGKLETLEDRTQETDTDWGVIRIPEEPATLRGMVVDADTRSPINDVRVELWSSDETEIRRATATWDGAYLMEGAGLLSGNYVIYFIKNDYEKLRQEITLKAGDNVYDAVMAHNPGWQLTLVAQALTPYGPIVKGLPLIQCMVEKRAVWLQGDNSTGTPLRECAIANPGAMLPEFNTEPEKYYYFMFHDYLTQAIRFAEQRTGLDSSTRVEFGTSPWTW